MRWIHLILMILISQISLAARLKDISTVRGVRSNQLVGYGLVVGLNGTGDSKLELTQESLRRMYEKLGVSLKGEISTSNVAAVLVVADLPPFSRAGNKVDVRVSSVGDATDLSGGTLVMTPLKAANEEVYAVAQGRLLISPGTLGGMTSARIPAGAMIEKDIEEEFSKRRVFRISLKENDFTTASRVARTLNEQLGGLYANALDGTTIDLIVPYAFEGKGVELLSLVENIKVKTDTIAKVVINQKTGTVIIGDNVRISKVAISHGNISVKVIDESVPLEEPVRGPAGARDPKGPSGPAYKEQKINMVEESASVGDLINGLNQLGVTPKDLISILESVKAAGALHGELEIL